MQLTNAYMINKKIEEIRESDLQVLIDNKVPEGKTIEYKKEWSNKKDAEARKEFLADITSFANSSGGDLIFGISQDNKTGEPKAIEGIEVENADKEKTRLDNIIRDGIEPRLLSTTIQPISLSNSKFAILIRIPKTWIAPHRVIYGGNSKFYARNSSGKYEMDVDELRIAFNLTETLTERIRKFQIDRISKIFADETPVPFYKNPKIVLHLIPINAFNPSQKYDIGIITSNHGKLPPIYYDGCSKRFNLEGFLTYSADGMGKSYSYVQLYRNGIIEAVEGRLLKPEEKGLFIPSILYEEKLLEAFNSYLKVLAELRVDPPIFVFLSLLGVKGYKMAITRNTMSQHPIDRDLLLLPEAVVENYDIKTEEILRPLFDLIWNACGFQRSLNFDKN